MLPNGMDAVADRDFALEFLSCCSITMMHLSRFCEELILWSSVEFGFVEIDDAYSTGSSIMPQKKNPDMAELIRGKSGRVYGDLMALLTVCKGLPLAYNKDLQEDKEPVFDAADTVKNSLGIFTEMISTMAVRKDSMAKAAKYGYMNATDAADYLVGKGIPFRDCHEIIGKMVLYAIGNGKALDELTMEEFKSFSDAFDEDIYEQDRHRELHRGEEVRRIHILRKRLEADFWSVALATSSSQTTIRAHSQRIESRTNSSLRSQTCPGFYYSLCSFRTWLFLLLRKSLRQSPPGHCPTLRVGDGCLSPAISAERQRCAPPK